MPHMLTRVLTHLLTHTAIRRDLLDCFPSLQLLDQSHNEKLWCRMLALNMHVTHVSSIASRKVACYLLSERICIEGCCLNGRRQHARASHHVHWDRLEIRPGFRAAQCVTLATTTRISISFDVFFVIYLLLPIERRPPLRAGSFLSVPGDCVHIQGIVSTST